MILISAMILISHFILLTALQCRILLTLFMDGGLGTAALLKSAGLSGGKWQKDRRTLESLGLIQSCYERHFTGNRVTWVRRHNLTEKGHSIARSIAAISEELGNNDVKLPTPIAT